MQAISYWETELLLQVVSPKPNVTQENFSKDEFAFSATAPDLLW